MPQQPWHLQLKTPGCGAVRKAGLGMGDCTLNVLWVSCACVGLGLALPSLKHSPSPACGENIPAGVLPFPLLPAHKLVKSEKETFRRSWHGELNGCLKQEEAAPKDGCPAFGSNLMPVTDRANSACPLPSYNLITYTFPQQVFPCWLEMSSSWDALTWAHDYSHSASCMEADALHHPGNPEPVRLWGCSSECPNWGSMSCASTLGSTEVMLGSLV